MMLDMTEDEFYSKFEMVENHLDDNASLSGCMFETYGEELEYIKSLDGTKKVWTFLEGDEGNQYFMTGMRLVNRIGYFITTEPYTEEYEVKLYSPTNEV